ncbi:hypothetical protein [Paraburkholderia metrosideri]|uniref:Uncharacterized protein n=1 Tax=Paraburkholderia metrosideri TaxID=580937 RepID=A0ABN7HX95_9BURK|nr:hypothetical protein [Paraburkholderia metrosideri]CAD6542890.1 hypothetical protein LMG28140_03834 [Paraburkholderia metrosideri]
MKVKREPRTKNEHSIVALAKLIANVIANPSAFVGDDLLLSALKRQSRLGHLSRAKMGIHATSRCTIERTAERIFEGGFERFDEERLKALERIQEAMVDGTKPKRRTKASLECNLRAAEAEHVQVLVDCWQITNAFHEALKQARVLANLTRNAALVEHWNQQESVLLSMFSLAKRPVVKKDSEVEKWLKQLRY